MQRVNDFTKGHDLFNVRLSDTCINKIERRVVELLKHYDDDKRSVAEHLYIHWTQALEANDRVKMKKISFAVFTLNSLVEW